MGSPERKSRSGLVEGGPPRLDRGVIKNIPLPSTHLPPYASARYPATSLCSTRRCPRPSPRRLANKAIFDQPSAVVARLTEPSKPRATPSGHPARSLTPSDKLPATRHPGGMPAISRGLSEARATPPEFPPIAPDPSGVAASRHR